MVASRTQAPACIQRYRLYLALAAGITAGIAKEGADFLQLWPGTVSVKDLAADVLGSLLVAAGLFWWEQRTVIKARFVDLELGTVYGNPIRRALKYSSVFTQSKNPTKANLN
mmetsp:Transcript_33978/g.101120  ORF Transcript_33978/g.101120 Transcript_33978/m.101120 type:complete len:112 (-) Transcript_33978:1329-1664(-)